MSLKTTLYASLIALAPALPAIAGDIAVEGAYARASSAMAQSGAAFMTLVNTGAEDDRLIAAASDAAERVELHTHVSDANGVMRMIEVEDGFRVPAHGHHDLRRGGDHVMLLGLTRPLTEGDIVGLTLTFEKAGTVEVDAPVESVRSSMGNETDMPMKGHMAH
ncbi:copper chaperone PCu(A)C [Rhodovulum sulfidophilum]|uniref:Copper chaperone PCu(A)C n=1 Tax=Rhodovulum sulfidophilum TaxID=35806 RepID=A0ABS1RWQ9_RHOSU|nr:copper chaperone PCu(A)C [Rhodovulum sulfidophilum]MBL3610514.1 copper chaperone PCu(A)C [Rhodovulum sulfidophilum]MCE8459477.1 copper chaperone PCu(A)C [Rhodovulum sulfidophilum]